MALVFVQEGADSWVVQIGPRDNAPDEVMGGGELEVVGGIVGPRLDRVVGPGRCAADHHGTFEAVAFQNGEQEVRRV